jgi:hypothetical protein
MLGPEGGIRGFPGAMLAFVLRVDFCIALCVEAVNISCQRKVDSLGLGGGIAL